VADCVEFIEARQMTPSELEHLRRVGRDLKAGRRMSFFVLLDCLAFMFPDKPTEEICAMAQEAISVSDYRH
jgi:hypothetical protein